MKSLLFVFLFLCATILLHAQQPGTLDASFGNKGTLVDTSVVNIQETAIQVTKEGRILIGTTGPYKGLRYTFRIDALLPDGSPDLSFGENGSAYVIFPGQADPASYSAGISALALLPDGRILAAGGLEEVGNPGDLAFARFKPDGTVDSSFGTNGTATASFGQVYESILSLTLQPDGRIVTTGGESVKYNGGGFIDYVYRFATARYLPNGGKDSSFGRGGIVINNTDFPYGIAHAAAIQKDGKIVSAGFSGVNTNSSANFHIERYNEDGSYDESFGSNGILDTKINGADINMINDMVLQEDGKLVVTGDTHNVSDENHKFTTVRYNINGSLDESFNNGGVVVTSFLQNGGVGKKVFITGGKGDKIVVAGSNYSSFIGQGNFTVAGYNMDGTLDTAFGNKGIQTTDFGSTDYVTTAVLQSNGKIILEGTTLSFETSNSYRALARYYGYPQKVPLLVRIKRWLQNHTITWQGLPAEDKIAYYSVEQSSNSSKGFTTIAKVSGRNNLKDYSITNSNLLQGTNYYRIKAVSNDGVIRYSEVVSADNTTNTASVYPNPAKSYVTVQGLPATETANISIKDGSGNVMSKGVSNGSTQYRSQLSNNMQPGTYYVNITTGDKTETLKFVKE